MIKRMEAEVIGLVQGVGFRYFVYKNALALNLKGLAKNLINGNVEVIAEGEESDLNLLIDLLKMGPSRSFVKEVKYRITDSNSDFDSFYTA